MIYIRTDSNPYIGMGHIMRCLSVADSLTAAGQDVTFILSDESADFLVRERGYKTSILRTDYTKMEEEIEFWPPEQPDFIIVDSYFVTRNYLSDLKKRIGENGRLVYIDDLTAFPYPADILINYNAYGANTDYEDLYKNSDVHMPRLLLGSVYVPLRTMFRGIPKKKQRRVVKEVLFSTGGADGQHLSLRFLRYLQSDPSSFHFHILVGNMNIDKEEIGKLAANMDSVMLHENVADMRGLITSMDLAVCAAGSTLYEICACGVPLITYILADNQILGAEAFEGASLAVNCGDLRSEPFPGEKILAEISKLAEDYEKRVETGERMQKMIDGYGADRMANELLK